ncbi:MAG: MogA/MoaB family molybdenum cofactor biosynthesis protein [Thaumarchaeota archaeon]|nr:MogA/MoaB family molybdenum cofactor biosynthesis protein [Nitrososphaerota archaeon]MCS4539812.1 MogA/MoaB family molybdenum cofactor biosynthesis protein [Nitrososphaerota archaeon]
MKAHELHRAKAPERLGFYIVTVSTSRYRKKALGERFADESGDAAERIALSHKHRIVGRELIADDAGLLMSALESGMAEAAVDVVLFTGGTGVSPTDITVETIRPLLEKELEGFGEILRSRSFRRIGPAAILTRATAGIRRGKLLLCLPGSPDGVKTALGLFMRDLPHVVYLSRG